MSNSSLPSAQYLKDYQAPVFGVDTIELTVFLDDHKTKVISKVRYLKQLEGEQVLRLNGEQQTLLEVKLAGVTLNAEQYQLTDEELVITTHLSEFELEITTEIDPANNSSLEGLYKSGGAFCTQCEAQGFRKITYYLDRPDVLAKYTTHIIGNKSIYPHMLSNGNKIEEVALDDGLTKVTWQDPYPKPSYLFALVAGDFDVLEDNFTTASGRKVDLALFVDKGNLSRAPFAMESLKKSMAWDESRFGLEYDLDIYMIVAVDFFNMGAMENKGLNVFNSKCVLADSKSATDADYLMIESIVGHEYFHNWTGNRITCRDWFQLSLKEGLTVFRDQEFSMDLGSRAHNRIEQVKVMRSHQFAEDAGPMSHPIRPESVIEMNNFYTVTVYDKGAEVIRMLHSILGEQGFQAGMKLYVERHDGHAVTCDDFVAAMQDANTEHDLTLFKLWYSQSGTPNVNANMHYDKANKKLTIKLSQVTAPTADQVDKKALHIPVNTAFFDQSGQPMNLGGQYQHVLNLTANEQTFEFESVEEQPLVSFLRDFSAPVQFSFDYSDEELTKLIIAETSDYTRWELAQQLYIKHIKLAVSNNDYVFPTAILTCIEQVIGKDSADPQITAELLKVPGFSTLLAEYKHADVDAILAAQDKFTRFLANGLANKLTKVIAENAPSEYIFNATAMAKRAFRNAALNLLSYSDDKQVADLISNQYYHSDNMTDSLAALKAGSTKDDSLFKTLMADFENKWTGDPLVMDKWLALCASHEHQDVLANILELESHRDFTLDNPNRVRALYGNFAMNNPAQFHRKDGAGYRFLTDKLIQLNEINPQVAARLITPLIQVGNLDGARKLVVKKELTRLNNTPNLSKDLFEKVTKCLETTLAG
ncbi:aminopeptidase N [Marinifaba aquimaris]|uniref:aminopeptidase N n=1 Tax=Marinifaba aquimaris TaxID=2741323 RepID=UPI001C2CF693|nr:aminopeptidase N [Marinifaba aquimaris]